MKAEKQKRGIFRRAIGALTHNWELKILSIGLAIVIYHSLKTKSEATRNPHDTNIFQSR